MKTAERTIERPRVERAGASKVSRRSMITPVLVVVALLLGVLGGFLLWGMDDSTSSAVAVGGDDLTARQEQMVDMINEAEAAWRVSDGDAVADMFTQNGTLTIGSTVFRGREAIADYVSSTGYSSLDVLEPMLVSDNSVLTFHTVSGFGTLSEVMEFTSDGELLLVSHDINR